MNHKKILLLVALLSMCQLGKSQFENKTPDKRLKFGFSIGLNYSAIKSIEKLADSLEIKNHMGFRIGMVSEYKLFKPVFFSPKFEISFNGGELISSNNIYKVVPVTFDVMAHLIVKLGTEDLKSYFLIGPNYRVSPGDQKVDEFEVLVKSDFAIDFGIGMDKRMTNIHFLPEIRYSYGLVDISNNSAIQSLNNHTISLVFIFRG